MPATRSLLSLSLSLSLCLLHAQSILVKPYLQNATPTSINLLWETDSNTETMVHYGLTPALGNSVSGTAFNSLGGTIHHDAALTGLTPGTRYYYQAETGTWASAIYDFVTPGERSAEQSFNIALMSDMQRDNGNPDIFHDLVNESLIPYLEGQYGDTLNAHLQMVMIPGDLVDNGANFLQWKNHFFNPAEELWHAVPVYPSPGNHELNSQNYFNYFHVPHNGTPGYEEHWYATDYSNVRVLSLDSNTPYRIAAQLNWVDSMLTESCNDTFIDFVFAQLHHPHKSELWVPGEIDYTGQVIQRLEAFTDSCGKPTVHFFGHTHAYSRGHSRDHQHVWMNVATAGGNIDYWGEFQNADYEEFVISQDEYGFVIAEITAGEDPQFVLRRLSFGDQFHPGGSTEVDLVTIRRNNTPPQTPLPLFPVVGDTISPICATFKADEFLDPDGDVHGATQWQISLDSMDFSAPVADHWKQYQNWYQEVDLQAGDDLTDEEFEGLDPDGTYFWRVRYRDKNLAWSAWSAPVRFETGPDNALTGNLVLNGDAESGPGNWTVITGIIESLAAGECSGINPYAGSRYFAVGALCVEYAFASVYQTIDVTPYADDIDAGGVLVNYGGYLANWQNTDIPAFALQFRDASNAILATTDTVVHTQAAWTLKERTEPVPIGTRSLRFNLMGTRTAGTDNDSYFDNVFLRLLDGESECSAYVAPGPVHHRLYVDQDAIGVPNGESWAKAYRTVGDALLQGHADTSVHEIWVATGIYPVTQDLNRDTAFYIARAIGIYGGFDGSETALAQQDPIAYPVVLTGEIGDTSMTDNTYHVFVINHPADTVRLDGLVITGGYADGPDDLSGGGLLVVDSGAGVTHVHASHLVDHYAMQGMSIANTGHLVITESVIDNVIPEGHTGALILNSGPTAHLVIDSSLIRFHCVDCPGIILNTNGAVSRILESVEVLRQ